MFTYLCIDIDIYCILGKKLFETEIVYFAFFKHIWICLKLFLSLCQQRLHFSDKNTPQRHPSDQSESFSTPLVVFPWERDDTRPATRRQSPISPQMPCADVIDQGKAKQGDCGKEKDSCKETDGE